LARVFSFARFQEAAIITPAVINGSFAVLAPVLFAKTA
jgi:hypothetical protein